MKCRGLAARAVLLHLESIWIITSILASDVVALFALHASHCDFRTDICTLACHVELLALWVYLSLLRLFRFLGVERSEAYPSLRCFTKVNENLVAEAGFEPTTQRL